MITVCELCLINFSLIKNTGMGSYQGLLSFNYRRTLSPGTLLLLLHAMNSDTTPLTEHLSEGGRV